MADPEPQPDQGLMDSISRTYQYAKARYGGLSAHYSYADGGTYVPGGPATAWLDPNECVIALADLDAGRQRCCRPGHPTAASRCGRPDATIAPPADRDLS